MRERPDNKKISAKQRLQAKSKSVNARCFEAKSKSVNARCFAVGERALQDSVTLSKTNADLNALSK